MKQSRFILIGYSCVDFRCIDYSVVTHITITITKLLFLFIGLVGIDHHGIPACCVWFFLWYDLTY